MIKSISLQNFKCYKEETKFPLSKLNLFTGLNGKGKSTVLQALLLMKQTIEHSESANYLLLNGNMVNLGNFNDVKNVYSKTNSIYIQLEYELDGNTSATLKYSLSKPNEPQKLLINEVLINNQKIKIIDITQIGTKEGKLLIKLFPMHIVGKETENGKDVNVSTNIGELHYRHMDTFLNGNINYISASRINPENAYNVGNLKPTGGQTLLQYINSSSKIAEEVNSWFQYIFDENIKVEIKDHDGDPVIVRFYINGKKYLPTNIGFGYSYILPIIIAGVNSQSGNTLIVENPEAHLHPKAQSKLVEFLSKVANKGVQILLESHSDHILNALRVSVNQKNLAPEDVNIFFFTNQENDTQPKIFKLEMDEYGGIFEWPKGFFDQTETDIKILLDLK